MLILDWNIRYLGGLPAVLLPSVTIHISDYLSPFVRPSSIINNVFLRTQSDVYDVYDRY